MKVRIPFVINPEGRWAAQSYTNEKEADWGFMMDCADGGVDSSSDYQRGWIEVDLPVPSVVTVDGTAMIQSNEKDAT